MNTPYSEFRRAGRLGVHHIAFMSKDSVADAARAKAQGFTRQIEMREPQGFRHYYCQSPAMPELWIEFLQSNPGLNEFFASGIADTARWDGKSAPVRNVEAGPPQ